MLKAKAAFCGGKGLSAITTEFLVKAFFFFFFSKRSEVGELAIRRPDAQATCWPGRQIATMGSYGRHAQGSKAAALLLRMEL